MVGGMPADVAADIAGQSARACRELQRDLAATYRADFAKYGSRVDRTVIDDVLHAVALSLGRKFVYAHVGEGVKQHQAKRALELLAGARVANLVRYSAANGLPLGGEVKDTFRKAILVDVGLYHALAGTPAGERFPNWKDLAPDVPSSPINSQGKRYVSQVTTPETVPSFSTGKGREAAPARSITSSRQRAASSPWS